MRVPTFLVAAVLVAGAGAAVVWWTGRDRGPGRSESASDERPAGADARAGNVPGNSRRANPGERIGTVAPPNLETSDSATPPPHHEDLSPDEWTQQLLAASPGELGELFSGLDAEWSAENRLALLDAVGGWLAARRVDHVREAAVFLLRREDPDLVLEDLYRQSTSAIEGDADREELFAALGYQLAAVLSGRYGQELALSTRSRLVHSLIRFGGTGTESERGLVVAAALGGASDEVHHAAQHLAGMVRESDDARVRGAAARELGRVATAPEMLDLHGTLLEAPPSGPDDAEVCTGMVSGLLEALRRRPDDSPLVTPVFERILMDWRDTRENDQIRSSLLVGLMLQPVAELEPTLRTLAADDASPVAPLARKALRAVEER